MRKFQSQLDAVAMAIPFARYLLLIRCLGRQSVHKVRFRFSLHVTAGSPLRLTIVRDHGVFFSGSFRVRVVIEEMAGASQLLKGLQGNA